VLGVKRFNIENFSKLTAILANAYMEEVRPRSGREAGLGHVGGTIPWMESVESRLERRPRTTQELKSKREFSIKIIAFGDTCIFFTPYSSHYDPVSLP